MSAILDRILKQMGDQEIIEKLLSLPKQDLNSLLLELFERQVDKLTPADILKMYHSGRFATPSEADPARFHSLEVQLLSAAKEMDIKTVLLSPSAPLGSCSSFGYVDQYNVVSALRGTETLSDPSNMLAIIIADKLKNRVESNTSPLHYATTSRVVRAQAFSGRGFFAHFGLFCMVSSAKDMALIPRRKNYSKNTCCSIKSCYKSNLKQNYPSFCVRGADIKMGMDFLIK